MDLNELKLNYVKRYASYIPAHNLHDLESAIDLATELKNTGIFSESDELNLRKYLTDSFKDHGAIPEDIEPLITAGQLGQLIESLQQSRTQFEKDHKIVPNSVLPEGEEQPEVTKTKPYAGKPASLTSPIKTSARPPSGQPPVALKRSPFKKLTPRAPTRMVGKQPALSYDMLENALGKKAGDNDIYPGEIDRNQVENMSANSNFSKDIGTPPGERTNWLDQFLRVLDKLFPGDKSQLPPESDATTLSPAIGALIRGIHRSADTAAPRAEKAKSGKYRKKGPASNWEGTFNACIKDSSLFSFIGKGMLVVNDGGQSYQQLDVDEVKNVVTGCIQHCVDSEFSDPTQSDEVIEHINSLETIEDIMTVVDAIWLEGEDITPPGSSPLEQFEAESEKGEGGGSPREPHKPAEVRAEEPAPISGQIRSKAWVASLLGRDPQVGDEFDVGDGSVWQVKVLGPGTWELDKPNAVVVDQTRKGKPLVIEIPWKLHDDHKSVVIDQVSYGPGSQLPPGDLPTTTGSFYAGRGTRRLGGMQHDPSSTDTYHFDEKDMRTLPKDRHNVNYKKNKGMGDDVGLPNERKSIGAAQRFKQVVVIGPDGQPMLKKIPLGEGTVESQPLPEAPGPSTKETPETVETTNEEPKKGRGRPKGTGRMKEETNPQIDELAQKYFEARQIEDWPNVEKYAAAMYGLPDTSSIIASTLRGDAKAVTDIWTSWTGQGIDEVVTDIIEDMLSAANGTRRNRLTGQGYAYYDPSRASWSTWLNSRVKQWVVEAVNQGHKRPDGEMYAPVPKEMVTNPETGEKEEKIRPTPFSFEGLTDSSNGQEGSVSTGDINLAPTTIKNRETLQQATDIADSILKHLMDKTNKEVWEKWSKGSTFDDIASERLGTDGPAIQQVKEAQAKGQDAATISQETGIDEGLVNRIMAAPSAVEAIKSLEGESTALAKQLEENLMKELIPVYKKLKNELTAFVLSIQMKHGGQKLNQLVALGK